MEPIPPSMRQQPAELQNLPIATLNLKPGPLRGREKEEAIIQEAVKKVSTKKQMITIAGYSGSGKSCLAQRIVGGGIGLFVQGKFDQTQCQDSREPLLGFLRACEEICQALRLEEDESKNGLRERMQKDLSSERTILTTMIPSLEETIWKPLSDTDSDTLGVAVTGLNSTETKHRFNYAFVRFMAIVAEFFQGLTLVLDDLQWSDQASLDLMDNLLLSQESIPLVIVGTYRSNEVDEDHPLARHMKGWRVKDDLRFDWTVIQIKDLELPAVHSMVQDILDTDDPTTISLAEICLRKTHGNPFFLKYLLSTLYSSGHLSYKLGRLQWVWDIAQIEEDFQASDNVVDFLRSKIASLELEKVDILKLASCLGTKFKVSVLDHLWQELNGIAATNNQLPKYLKSLTEDGFLELLSLKEPVTSTATAATYRFTHDNVLETVKSMVPQEDRPTFLRKVSNGLCNYFVEDLDSSIFVITDLLNQSMPPADIEQALHLAHLNCRACKKSVTLSAFETARIYATKGIQALEKFLTEQQKWRDNRELSLELHTMAAEADSYLGNLESLAYHCEEVLPRTDLSFVEKYRLIIAQIDSMANTGKVEEASEKILNILRQFNHQFPTNQVSTVLKILGNVARLMLTLSSYSTKQKPLKQMDDETRIGLVALLDKLTLFWYMTNDDRMPLAIFQSVRWTRKHGINSFCPAALASQAVILTGVLFDFKAGARVGNYALWVLDQVENKLKEARVYFYIYSNVMCWTRRFEDCIVPLMHAYEVGMRTGDCESACWAIIVYIEFQLFTGVPLGRQGDNSRKYLRQIKDLNRLQIYHTGALFHQRTLILMGGDEGNTDDIKVCGSVVSEELYNTIMTEDKFAVGNLQRCEDYLSMVFGRHEELAKRVVSENGADLPFIGSPYLIEHAFVRGISCFAAFGETRVTAYKKMGKKMRSTLASWVRKGNPNALQLKLALDAEFAAATGRWTKAKAIYEYAIRVAAKTGHLHEAAVMSERLGVICLLDKDTQDGAYRLRQAVQFYKAWGAMRKVTLLEEKYSDLFACEES